MVTLMSRGPGKVERAIEALFAKEPDNAFTTNELSARVYSGVDSIEKKHRVAVVRAAKAIAKRRDDIAYLASHGLGGMLVFYRYYDLMSYAMARLKSESTYEHNDKRLAWAKDEAKLRAQLAKGGQHSHLLTKGGAWRLHIEQRLARRDGNDERAAEIETELNARLARTMEAFKK